MLFCCIMNGLADKLERKGKGGVLIRNPGSDSHRLRNLSFADDLLLVSNVLDDGKENVQIAQKWCRKWYDN